MRKPTVYDVAQEAGVSIATVSFAFSKPERVKSSTLAEVLDAASRLGYVPSGSARGLARGRTRALGLYAFDYLLEPSGPTPEASGAADGRLFPLYADEVQRGIELECRDRGYALMIGAGRDAQNTSAIVDVAGRVDGLITFASVAAPEALAAVAARIPVIELGGAEPGSAWPSVEVDNAGGMRAVVDHLVDAHGASRLEYVGSAGSPEMTARLETFRALQADRGLAATDPVDAGSGDVRVRRAIEARLDGGALPDAFVCATDQLALVVLDALRERGVDVPGRVAVTGFDGILATRLSAPTLTTVRQPMEEIGRRAVRMLVGAIERGVAPEPSAVLPVHLVVAGSCGC